MPALSPAAGAGALFESLDVLLRGMPGVDAVRVRVVVTGRVQGVWFRDACREQAQSERVAGFVRNRMDGSVEAEDDIASGAIQAV